MESKLLRLITESFFAQEVPAALSKFTFNLNGFFIEVISFDSVFLHQMTKSFEHLKVKNSNKAIKIDLTIYLLGENANHIEDELSLFVTTKKNLLRIQSSKVKFLYNPGFNGAHVNFSYFNEQKKIAAFWVRDIKNIPEFEKASPFRMILNWWVETKGWFLLHAASVGYLDKGLIIVGKSGKGKTSTALTALTTGKLSYIGDDYILLDQKKNPWAVSLYSSAKLDSLTVKRFPELKKAITKSKDPTQKSTVYLNDFDSKKIVRTLPVKAVVIPQVKNSKESTYESIPPSQALFALAPSTIFQLLPENPTTHSFSDITKLVSKLPCYQFYAGHDKNIIAQKLKELLDELN